MPLSIVVPVKNEAKRIEPLLRGILVQTYRPLEVVFIDGGSTDGTLEMLEEFSREAEKAGIKVKILAEEGPIRSPANARNIGVLNSNGSYIIFLDADMVMLDKDFCSKVKEGLSKSLWVGVQTKSLVDTLVEKALAAEALGWSNGRSLHLYCGVRRTAFEKRTFDPCLGFGEDRDFFEHYLRRELGIEPLVIDTWVGRHEPHTVKEFVKQQLFYGKTVRPT